MILTNGRILNETTGLFEPGEIRIADGLIREIGDKLVPKNGEEVIDLKSDLVIPGLMNSHYHSYTNLLSGTSFGDPLEVWSLDTVELGRTLEAEELVLSARLGILEMIKGGVTACIDHIPQLAQIDEIASFYQASGFPVGLAPMIQNLSDGQILYGLPKDEVRTPAFLSTKEIKILMERLASRFHDPNGPSRLILGLNAPQRADEELLGMTAVLAREFDLAIHAHALESRWQKLTADHGESPIQRLDRHGLLSEKTSLAHGIHVGAQELDLLAKRGVTIVTNPTSNAFLGSGTLPAEGYRARSIPLAIGSDGLNCGTNHNLLEILRFFLLMQRLTQPDQPKWIPLTDALMMLTRAGQRLLGREGGIRPGARADLAVLDRSHVLDILPESLLHQVIFHAPRSAVRHVLIGGAFAMKERQVLLLDEEALRSDLARAAPDLRRRFSRALQDAKAGKTAWRGHYDRILRGD